MDVLQARWNSLSDVMHTNRSQFSVFVSVNEKGKAAEAVRVPHERSLYRDFLTRLPANSTISVEASGHYSWLVDEMEQLGHYPKLANPLEAKRHGPVASVSLRPSIPPSPMKKGSASGIPFRGYLCVH